MRSLVLGLALFSALAASTTIAAANDFCAGFENGYQAGYCYGQSFCIKPLPPLCPLPNLGESSFQDGYNRGFLAGMAAHG